VDLLRDGVNAFTVTMVAGTGLAMLVFVDCVVE
jgi:hypothetical protein